MEKPFEIKRVYTLSNGESAMGRIEIPLKSNLGNIGIVSGVMKSNQGFLFRYTPGNYYFDSHTAPQEQLIVNLNAGVEVTTHRDGPCKINSGECFFVEDTTGKGHISKAVQSQERFSIFIPVSKKELKEKGCIFHD